MLGVKKVSDKFYIYWTGGKRFEQIDGRPVVFPGFEGYDFFIHDSHDMPNAVSEATSGHRVSRKGSTEEEALESALCILKDQGLKSLDKAIMSMIDEFGVSPRYEKE